MDPPSYSVQLTNVAKTYGDHNVAALIDVSLSVRKSEFVAVMGPSGCGKSSMLNLIAGIDRPSSGRVLLCGQDLSELTDEQMTKLRAKRLGFVFQFFNLLSTLTVEENVALPLELARVPSATVKQKVNAMLNRFQIAERAAFYPSQLSGGEMQRTAIARALIHSPEVILADEPTGNLDSDNGKNVLTLLRSIVDERDNGGTAPTVIMATHSLEAANAADRCVMMKDGRIVEPQSREG